MIPMNYTQWLGIRKKATGVNDKASVETFFTKYVLAEVGAVKVIPGAARPDALEKEWWTLLADMGEAGSVFKTAYQSKNWAAAGTALDVLVAKLNGMRSKTLEGGFLDDKSKVARYDAEGVAGRGWNDALHAVAGMDAMVIASRIAATKTPAIAGVPAIPTVCWSVFKAAAPLSLIRLIRDIRNTHRLQIVLDTRTDGQRHVKADNPKQPASLRSWHMNDQGALPIRTGLPAAPPPPAPAPAVSPLHAHLTATATGPFNNKKVTSPIGYAEYTGTGIIRDMHNSKIVLDYVSGDVYLTVTHYQRWDKRGSEYRIRDKESGERSAWFYIDFTT